MGFVSYAQNFEDVVLWKALRDVRNGRYLDIGAHDPVSDSVSLAFYREGWRGVHVEPTPAYAERLRAARPDEVVIQAAVSDAADVIDFFEFPGTGLSTGVQDLADRHANAGFQQRKIIVPSITLEHLFEGEREEVHWVKIDVEGMEPEALRSWGKSKCRPWLFVVEATVPLTQQRSDEPWCGELLSRGYREVYFDGLSRYFLHQSQEKRSAAFQAPPNIFDEFSITRAHFTAVPLRDELQNIERELAGLKTSEIQLRSQITATEQQLSEKDELVSELGQLLKHASEERDSAKSEQATTYEAWLAAEREHRSQIQELLKKAEDVEIAHRLEIQEIRTTFEVARKTLRQECDERQRRLSRAEKALLLAQEHAHQVERDLENSHLETERLRSEVAILRARLNQARETIDNALAVPPERWQRLGRTLGFVRHDDVIRTLLQSWKSEPLQLNAQPLDRQVPMPNAEPDYYVSSLSELVSLDGVEFVRSAYATVLGRESDADGEEYYSRRLREHVPKLQILHQMRKSPEARLMPDRLPGLDDVINMYRIRSVFVGKQRASEAVEARVRAEGKRVHVREFMRYHDEDFVRVVYLFYLDREPDTGGLQHHVEQLRRGVSRHQVLLEVAQSDEAKTLGKKAIGQDSLKRALALRQIPVLGRLYTAMKFNLELKEYMQDMRALENHLYRITKNIG